MIPICCIKRSTVKNKVSTFLRLTGFLRFSSKLLLVATLVVSHGSMGASNGLYMTRHCLGILVIRLINVVNSQIIDGMENSKCLLYFCIFWEEFFFAQAVHKLELST